MRIQQINWKLKSFVFHIIDIFGALRLLYFLQKYVTKGSRVEFKSIHKNWRRCFEEASRFENVKLFEFGAGKNFAKNLYLYRETPEFVKSLHSELEPNETYILDINSAN